MVEALQGLEGRLASVELLMGRSADNFYRELLLVSGANPNKGREVILGLDPSQVLEACQRAL